MVATGFSRILMTKRLELVCVFLFALTIRKQQFVGAWDSFLAAVESLWWNPFCGIIDHCCGIAAVESLMWNHCCGIITLESPLCNHFCGIIAAEPLRWNYGCGVIGV